MISPEKEYQITLKKSELEFIRLLLSGISEIMENFTKVLGTCNFTYEKNKKDRRINTVELEEKIYEQYYNDGELL